MEEKREGESKGRSKVVYKIHCMDLLGLWSSSMEKVTLQSRGRGITNQMARYFPIQN